MAKDVKLKLISELMKNSRRSDRELAKALGISQPTVSRMIKKLEKEGIIQSYSMLPDFSKIGFSMLAFTFARLKDQATPEELQKTRENVRQVLNKQGSTAIIGMSGLGCDADRVLVTFHEDYSAYSDFLRFIKGQQLVRVDEVKSFVVDLTDTSHFLPLNLTGLAGYILKNEALSKRMSKP